MSVNIKCVDLFCGCGGMSLGFQKAGFNIVAGIDNWKSAIRVYGMNFNSRISRRKPWQGYFISLLFTNCQQGQAKIFCHGKCRNNSQYDIFP